jgi:single-strand DNA-binding protein
MNTATTTATLGLVGNLTAEPELRFSKAGRAWTSFRLAVKPYVAGATEQPEPEYFEVICFGSLAENVSVTLAKGSRVAVVGKLEHETWTGRDGVERVTQKIIADGIGPDLRFAGTTSTRPKATEPAGTTRPTPVLDGLLGKEPARGYTDEPF